jgi:hypothetical protein
VTAPILQGFGETHRLKQMIHHGNSLKCHALDIFVLYGNLNPAAWAVLAQMHPARAAYTYLLRLHRLGLLNRARDPRGLLIYSISERGRERLRWLSSQHNPQSS